MQIADVLAAKGGRVVTVPPNRKVAALPSILDNNSISSVVVADVEGRLLGIVTDRIFLERLARRGPMMLDQTAAEVMDSPVPVCSPAEPISRALRRMTEERIRHLVVMDRGRVAGLVSIGDLVKAKLQDAELESRVLREMALGHLASAERPHLP